MANAPVTCYYSSGPGAARWLQLREAYRARAMQAKSPEEFESMLDMMIGEQPLIKPVVTSAGAVVVSGHPLASQAGRQALERGGNIVDALVATSFALGVVEPEASGVGGDGAAVLFLKGMKQPTIIDYKDMTPIRATPDNPAIMSDGRIVADGPAAANIPGVVAGLDYLYRGTAAARSPGRTDRAGDCVGGRGLSPRRIVADEHCRRPAFPGEVA